MGSDSTGKMENATLRPSSGTLSVGETLTATYTYGSSPTGKAITVYVIHEPSRQKLFASATVIVQAESTSIPSAMLTVTADSSGNNVVAYDFARRRR